MMLCACGSGGVVVWWCVFDPDAGAHLTDYVVHS